jgi:uncharacterized protein YfaS (alpha-2-macroglobulin family)
MALPAILAITTRQGKPMSKHKITGYITYRPARPWMDYPEVNFFTFDPRKLEAFNDYIVIREHEFEVEIPDDFDPRPAQVAALGAELQKVRADSGRRCAEIEAQISALTAIEAS